MLKSKLLTNKYVLYFLLVLSIVNILGYIETNNFDALALFMLTGYIATNFTKNMIIVLLSAMLVSGCKVCVSALSNSLKEGFKEGNKTQAATATNKGGILFHVLGRESPDDCKRVNAKEKECKEHCDQKKGCDPKKAKNCYGCKDWNTHCNKDKPQFCRGKRSGFTTMMETIYGKPREGFSNMVELMSSMNDNKVLNKEKLDKKSEYWKETFNSSMGSLDRLMGTGNFEGLSSIHNKLIGNQKQLLESLSEMGPVIEGAKEKLEIAKTIDTKKVVQLMNRMNNGQLPGLMAKNQKK